VENLAQHAFLVVAANMFERRSRSGKTVIQGNLCFSQIALESTSSRLYGREFLQR